MKKNLLSILIALVLLLIAGECCAFAEGQTKLETSTWVNPLYAEYVQGVELQFRRPFTLTPAGKLNTERELAEFVRQKLVERATSFTVDYVDANNYVVYNEEYNVYGIDPAFRDRILEMAYEHTGVPDEGDYIRWNVGMVSLGGSYAETEDGYLYSFEFAALLYSSRGEEAAVTSAVEAELERLDLDGKSDYEKAAAIYGYICDNVTYDYDNYDEFCERYLIDETYDVYYTMFSAYGAIHDRTAVCQGIAQLMYRMLLEEGVDCRLIAGMASSRDAGENHAWNIVKIGNEYFDADATWDLGYSENNYHYFLTTDDAFESGGVHKRGDDYSGSGFYAAYPMGTGEPLKAFHSGACRIESVELLKDGTVGIEIRLGAEAYEKDLLACAEIDGEVFPLKSAVSFAGEEGEVIKSFIIRKAPKEMKDGITLQISDGSGEPITLYDMERNNITDNGFRATVYAGIAEAAKGMDTAYAAAMNDLGACAQKFFGYHEEEASTLTGSLDGITALTLAPFAQSTSGILPEGLEYAGETLELDELTTVNFLFSGNAEDVDFTLDGNPAEPERNGGYYVISIPGLTAGDLGKAHVITVSSGENAYTVSASALSYAYKALTEQTGADLQELAKALYAWWAICN